MRNRKQQFYYYFKYFLIIIIFLIISGEYISSKYIYVNGLNMMNNGQIIVDDQAYGGTNETSEKLNNTYIPIFSNKEVTVEKLNTDNEIFTYNIFKVTGFEKYQKYQYNLEFQLNTNYTDSGINHLTDIIVGSQEVQPTNLPQGATNEFHNNIDLTNSVKFEKGNSQQFKIPLNLQATEKGECYFYIGIGNNKNPKIHYNISKVRLDKND